MLYCFYVASFAIVSHLWSPPFPPLAYVAAITGSVVGGIGAGFLWTSQGSFLTLSAHAIAGASQEDVTVVTARLASGQYLCKEPTFDFRISPLMLPTTSAVHSDTSFFLSSALYCLINLIQHSLQFTLDSKFHSS